MNLRSLNSMSSPTEIRRPITLMLEQGLHIRVCSKVVEIVTPFDGEVKIHHGERVADGSSMFDILQLMALPGAELVVEAWGEGAESVVNALAELFSMKHLPE